MKVKSCEFCKYGVEVACLPEDQLLCVALSGLDSVDKDHYCKDFEVKTNSEVLK